MKTVVVSHKDRVPTVTQADRFYLDSGEYGHVLNHHRAWTTSTDEWLLVLEDDAELCGDFDSHVAAELDHAPQGSIVSLYAGTGYPVQAQALYRRTIARAHALTTDRLYHAVAVAAPGDIARRISDEIKPDPDKPWDEQLSDWCRANEIAVHYPAVNHVNHADIDSLLPSTAWQPRRLPRRAVRPCVGESTNRR